MIRLEENKKSIPLTRFVSNFFQNKKERNNSALNIHFTRELIYYPVNRPFRNMENPAYSPGHYIKHSQSYPISHYLSDRANG